MARKPKNSGLTGPPHRRAILFMIFLLLYGFLFSFWLGVIFFLIGEFTSYEGAFDFRAVVTSPWFLIFGQVMGLLVPLGIWLVIFRDKLQRHLPSVPLGWKNIAFIAGISLLLVPVANVISGLTMFFFPNEIGDFMLEAFTQSGFLMMILAVAVTPAICEEIVFRGYIQSEYRYKTFWTMALINGLLFGVMHLNPQQFFYAFAMGVVFAYMVHVTGSVLAGVISHFVMNASSVSLLWFALRMEELFGDYIEAQPAPYPELLLALGMWGTLAIFATAAAVFLFMQFSRHNKGRVPRREYIQEANPSPEEIRASFFKIAPSPDEPEKPQPEEKPAPQSLQSQKNLLIDIALILIIVALYVFFVFA